MSDIIAHSLMRCLHPEPIRALALSLVAHSDTKKMVQEMNSKVVRDWLNLLIQWNDFAMAAELVRIRPDDFDSDFLIAGLHKCYSWNFKSDDTGLEDLAAEYRRLGGDPSKSPNYDRLLERIVQQKDAGLLKVVVTAFGSRGSPGLANRLREQRARMPTVRMQKCLHVLQSAPKNANSE